MVESDFIENARLVTDIFGYWPSFHDAEVVRICFDRRGERGPTVEAQVHVFHMTNDVDPRGYYVLTKHTLVTFEFENVYLQEFRWFNSQNSLWGITLQPIDPMSNDGREVGVDFQSNHGLESAFQCERVRVRSVVPFEAAV